MAINKRKTTTAVIASVAAAALLLGGTFAWNSISQQAKNESAGIVNVGGRLHDDFNGTNKDVYVENFTDPLKGGQPIYARIRLDEYMEVGPEAGKLDDTDASKFDADRNAQSVVTTADINDPSTWTPHKPSTDCTLCTGGETCLIHDHWTWDMAGQKTFMPTFNKDKDSLSADINGTYAGTDSTDNIHYDDYVTYVTTGGADVDVIAGTVNSTAVTIPAGTTANALTQANTDVTTVTNVAVYDDDSNTADDGNVRQETEKHTAKDTANGTVMTMAEWITAGKQPGNYWVYDTDGWAYWANPIMPGEATGLLLDGIEMTKNPGEKCYYAINVVGQFATAGDWEPFTTDGGSAPSANAMELLTNAVANVPVVTVTADGNVTTAAPGDTVQFNAGVTIGTTAALANGDFDWSVIDENGDPAASGIDADGKLTVNAGDVGKTLTVVARSKTYNGAVGISAIAIADSIATTDDMAATAYVLLQENGDTVQVDDGTGTTVAAPAYTLSFVRSNTKVARGDKYNGAEIKEVYVDMESKKHVDGTAVPWHGYRAQITKVSIDNKIQPVSTAYWFMNIPLTTVENLENLDTQYTTTMRSMFNNCTSLETLDLSTFDVGNVKYMMYMFTSCEKLETVGNISNWNVSNVESTQSMFYNCKELATVGDLSSWNVSNMTSTRSMFNGCSKFTEIQGIDQWVTSNVTDMSYMFYNCTSLTSLNLTGWDVSNVEQMERLFSNCQALTSVGDLKDWDVSKVTVMITMFYNCKELTTVGDLSGWDVGKVNNMYGMFQGCSGLTTVGNIAGWNTSEVTTMAYMFQNCSGLTLDLSTCWDVSKVTLYTGFNTGASNVIAPDAWTTAYVLLTQNSDGTTYTLNFMRSFTEPAVNSSYNGGTVTAVYKDVETMDVGDNYNQVPWYTYCRSITKVEFSGNVYPISTAHWFHNMDQVTTIDVDKINTSNATSLRSMFIGCTGLTSLDLSGWDVSKVTITHQMFANCTGLQTVDLSGWVTSSLVHTRRMFTGCTGLTTLTLGAGWNVSQVYDMSSMFNACGNLTLDCTGWDVSGATSYDNFNTGATGVQAPTWIN